VAENFLKITIPVETMTGALTITTFTDYIDQGDLDQILAAAPLTLSVVVDDAGMHLSLYTATIEE
jgi:hypothetical protein